MSSSPSVISSRPAIAQRGGLAAAGRADEDDELVVVHGQVEVLDGEHALVGDLEVVLLFLGLLFSKETLFLGFVGIDLLYVREDDLCHGAALLVGAPGGRTARRVESMRVRRAA